MSGFLWFSRASIMLDIVSVGMLLILPLLTYSLWLVKKKRNFKKHKTLQVSMGLGLLIVVLLFEIDIRINGWTHLAEPSPYYDNILFPFLFFHVTIASITTLLWLATIVTALKKFPNPPQTATFSPTHIKMARVSAFFMYLTGITGWIFYWMAFVA